VFKSLGSLIVASIIAGAPAAQAGAEADGDDLISPDRPGLADGSTVVGPNRFQIETGVQIEFRRAGDTREQKWFVPTLLRFGLAADLELRVEGNALTRLTASDPLQGALKTTGLSPTSVGMKYHLIASAGVSRPSVGVIARLFPPSGTSVFRTRHVTGDVRLAADWDFAPNWSLNPNIGVAAYEDDVGRAYAAGLFATTLNYNPTKAVTLFVDVGVQAPEGKFGRTSVILDVGVAYIIGRNVQLDLSAGYGAAGKTPPRPFVAAGLSARF
jgi:hypothetical protein